MLKGVTTKAGFIYVEMLEEELIQLLSARVNVWDFEGETLRIFLSDTDLLNLFNDYPEVSYFIDVVKNTTISKDGGRLIYLTELYPVHKALFESINKETGLRNYPSFIYELKE